MVVGDGDLADLPWQALPAADGRYLVESGVEVRTPGAERELLASPAREGRGLLALGDPDFGSPDHPAARRGRRGAGAAWRRLRRAVLDLPRAASRRARRGRGHRARLGREPSGRPAHATGRRRRHRAGLQDRRPGPRRAAPRDARHRVGRQLRARLRGHARRRRREPAARGRREEGGTARGGGAQEPTVATAHDARRPDPVERPARVAGARRREPRARRRGGRRRRAAHGRRGGHARPLGRGLGRALGLPVGRRAAVAARGFGRHAPRVPPRRARAR